MGRIRTVFFGTAELACCSLRGIAASSDIEVVGVVSQPDKARGRQLRLVPTAVKATALELQLPVWQPTRLRKDFELINHLKSLDLDVIVVAAYGQILPLSVLNIPRRGCVNVHTSLLPKYRGAAPIQWAILNGEETTGVTLMQMDEGMDTGAIIAQTSTPISPTETGGELHDRLAALGADFLTQTLPAYIKGELTPTSQDNLKASHARKLSKEDAAINWQRSAIEIANQVRGLNPWPGTLSYLTREGSSRLIKFWQSHPLETASTSEPGVIVAAGPEGIDISCGKESTLRVTQLQREGAKRLEAGPFLSGFPLQPGERFSPLPDHS